MKLLRNQKPGPTIRITISGPQGAGKTQLQTIILNGFRRLRQRGRIPATRIQFREVQTK